MPYIGKQPATISAVSVDTDTGTFSGQVAAASLDISGNVDVDGVLETDGISIASTVITSTAAELNILDGVSASAADINLIDGITNGTVIASKAIITDANKDISGGRNITISGELDAATLDISGDVDIDGTLEADAITVNGTALNTVIAGVTVSNATLAATTTVTDSTANTNFPVVFHDESNALLDDTGALRYNPSTGELLVPKLTVAGETTTVNTVTMQAANAVVFEGATANDHETTLTITDPTADRTITLPNVSGTLPILAADSNTAITSTPAEINLLDGSVANTVVNSKAAIYGSSGELAGALSTAAQPNVTSLGTLTTLTVDDITINGSTISDSGDFTLDIGGDIILDADGKDYLFKDGGTLICTMSSDNTDFTIRSEVQDRDLKFEGNDNGSVITALTLDMSAAGQATFNSEVRFTSATINSQISIYTDGSGAEIDNTSGNFTIDTPGTIILDGDAAGDTIHLKDGGTHFGSIVRNNSDLEIRVVPQDEDIVFVGNDGGSSVTALTLDMSSAGLAIFTGGVNLLSSAISFSGSISTPQVAASVFRPADNTLAFSTANNERMRVDSSGNLLVGKTSSDGAVVGHEMRPTSFAVHTVSGGVPLIARRMGSGTADDGDVITVQNNDGTVGEIGTFGSRLHISSEGNSGFRFRNDLNCVTPCNDDGSNSDNDQNLGQASVRYNTIFATNSSINTSDRNEKQDIEELTDAEKRVAIVVKGLMRKYRWKDAVASKGDNARIHFGVIAQDLQDAFTAESLDASKYAMFCSDTWWEKEITVDAVEADEEKGIEAKDAYTYMDDKQEATEGYTERTRLGIRYSELLAFIISTL
jgi:cytoskeletal protein CcmA (bactofilin family)